MKHLVYRPDFGVPETEKLRIILATFFELRRGSRFELGHRPGHEIVRPEFVDHSWFLDSLNFDCSKANMKAGMARYDWLPRNAD